ncbi:hypothetical protein A3I57_02455 [Candidatus Beckwithbacteria bacterium RIFCSPLOWO2_02_FULL_47_23]|uniref:Uncharacterized protein n=1 Tax=Candidatus Beckwithbacteria bacterium RIFCSPLOWO2_02_FULL_47_23 TaxID=1797463 RepID=A0A1F5DW51_9BACT|nr:MAG: hypothetical protein A3I57_02455 [Candidatus Beckwithbacteria bacterium RIFCSPLOWO2_02_FULL_47_23]
MITEFARKVWDVAWLSAAGVSQGKPEAKKLVERDRSNWQRGIDLFGLLHNATPVIKRIYPATLFDYNNLPLVPESLAFIGSGANQIVYRWGDIPGSRLALKIDRKTLDGNGNAVREAEKTRKNYLEVQHRFGDIKGLMTIEDFLVARVNVNYLFGLKAKTDVFFTIQPFFEGKIKDFFRDFTQDELRQKFNQNPIQEDRFVNFSERFFRTFFDEGLCLGVFGRNNLCVVDDSDNRGWQLHLLDAHGLFKPSKLFARSKSNIKSVAGKTLEIADLLKELAGLDYSERVTEFFQNKSVE